MRGRARGAAGAKKRSYRALRDGPGFSTFQAFHAWLPLFSPFGTPKITLIWVPQAPFFLNFSTSSRRGFSQAIISRALSLFFFTDTTYSVHIGDAALQAGVITK